MPLRGWTHKNSVFVRPLAQPLYAQMNRDEYEVEGNKATAKRLVYIYIFITVWPLILYLLQSVLMDCSLEFSSCTKEQIYTVFYIQAFAPLPAVLFLSYLGYYSLKVLAQKQIPPKGHTFPYSISKVLYRDHYTFGITGVILALLAIYILIDNVYFTIRITSI